MPVGIINVYHEPPTFNGVDRPEVDTLVIPSTWREPGFGIFGELTTGLSYQLYSSTASTRTASPPKRPSPTGTRKAMLAAARDFGAVGRLTYEPMLATMLGLSGYFATSGNSLRATVGNVPVGLFEVDARTRYRGFTARAEFAMLFIGDTGGAEPGAGRQRLRPRRCRSRSAARAATSRPATTCCACFCPTTEQSVTLFGRFDYVNTQASVAAGPHARQGVPPLRLHGRSRLPPDPADRAQGRLPPPRFGAGPGYNELAAALAWMF